MHVRPLNSLNRAPFCLTCELFTDLEDAGDSSHPQCAACHCRAIEWRATPPPPPPKIRFLKPEEGKPFFDKLRDSLGL
jgi:hypothetical protein